MKTFINKGYAVIAVAPKDSYSSKFNPHKIEFIELPIDTKGKNPIKDLLLLFRYIQIFKNKVPSHYLSFTIKPSIYGSIAARLCGISTINNITGLGELFIKETWLTQLIKKLYKLALSHSKKVFFQNNEDAALFLNQTIIPKKIIGYLPGSGVDLHKFQYSKGTKNNTFRFLLFSRLLWAKGVQQYADASKEILKEFPSTNCYLLGFYSHDKKAGPSERDIKKWESENGIIYLGSREDVREEIKKADCIVLPSYYREGTPRSLLEAAAMGKPIITTDSIGCKNVVDHTKNGYLCEPKSSHDLTKKMKQMLSLTEKEREDMGLYSRQKIEKDYDETIVINAYLNEIH